MTDFLRKYWFVCLIAIAFIAGLGYYIADLNKDNISGKQVDGKDVVASTSLGDVTSDEIFDNYQNFNQSLLYNMYKRAVVDQSVEATKEMETQAKTMARNIKANMEADATGKTGTSVISELASYGFEGEDSLEDYALFALKTRALDEQYILDHFDQYKDLLTSSPRTISVITMEVPNAEILTEEGQAKKDSIDKALENGDDFGKTATAFSEDTNTANKEGYFGYIDSNSTNIDSEVVNAAIILKKGETSDWITTQDKNSGMYVLYRVYVNETDPKAILESETAEDVSGIVAAYTNADNTIEALAVENKAKGLDVKFDNDAVKEKIDNAIAEATKSKDEAENKDNSSAADETKDDQDEAGAEKKDESKDQTASEESDKADQTEAKEGETSNDENK